MFQCKCGNCEWIVWQNVLICTRCMREYKVIGLIKVVDPRDKDLSRTLVPCCKCSKLINDKTAYKYGDAVAMCTPCFDKNEGQ